MLKRFAHPTFKTLVQPKGFGNYKTNFAFSTFSMRGLSDKFKTF